MLRTLSALSHSDKLAVSQVPGFPKKEKKLEKLIQKEKIYGNLRDLYASGNAADSEAVYGTAVRTPVKDKRLREDDIYQTICSPRKPRMSLDKSPFSKKNKRDYPIKEFIDSEERYLANLRMVKENFQVGNL